MNPPKVKSSCAPACDVSTPMGPPDIFSKEDEDQRERYPKGEVFEAGRIQGILTYRRYAVFIPFGSTITSVHRIPSHDHLAPNNALPVTASY